MTAGSRVADREYTLLEVAEAIGMSTRYVRDRLRLDGFAHQRYGKHIRFTRDQFLAFQRAHTTVAVAEPVTTGPAKPSPA